MTENLNFEKKIIKQVKINASIKTLKEKLLVAFTFLVIILFICCCLYWISYSTEKEKQEQHAAVHKGYGYGRGVITQIHYYKGQSLTVKYAVKGKLYEHNGGWDRNPKHLGKSDSISFKYTLSNPAFITTELESSYE